MNLSLQKKKKKSGVLRGHFQALILQHSYEKIICIDRYYGNDRKRLRNCQLLSMDTYFHHPNL